MSKIVEDVDVKGAQGATALSTQAVVLLNGIKHILAHYITDFILVVALESNKGCMDEKYTMSHYSYKTWSVCSEKRCLHSVPSTSSTFCLMSNWST